MVDVTDAAKGTQFATREFELTRNTGLNNTNHLGLWSDGTIIWVVENSPKDSDDKIFAYALSTGARDTAKDINTLNSAGNNDSVGIWSNGTTLWVSDNTDDILCAYTLSDGTRNAGKDIDLGGIGPFSIWSDGTTTF